MINNLKLEWGDKSLDYLNGEPHRTRVVLTNEDGAYYPIFFSAEDISKTDSELLKMALDVVYQKNFSGRAENEKFNTIGQKIAEMDDAIERSNKQYERVELLLKTTSKIVNAALMPSLTDDEKEATEDEPNTETN